METAIFVAGSSFAPILVCVALLKLGPVLLRGPAPFCALLKVVTIHSLIKRQGAVGLRATGSHCVNYDVNNKATNVGE